MSKLDDLLLHIKDSEAKVFRYNDELPNLMNQIENFYFFGEIDHDDLYLSQIEQVYVPDCCNCINDLYTISLEEAYDYYEKHKFINLSHYVLATSVHWRVNLKTHFVKVFVNRGLVVKVLGSPKDDYGCLYQDSLDKKCDTAEFNIDLCENDLVKSTFSKLISAVEYSKTHNINFAQFDARIVQNMSKFSGNLTENIIDDEYQESSLPELITIPHKHNTVKLNQDTKFNVLIKSPGYDEINYENNGIKYSFKGLKEANDFFYSAIEYINLAEIKPTVHPTHKPQYIDHVEKHWLSNKWPIAKDAEESKKFEEELTRYEVYITKFHDQVSIKLEVWEFGMVYIITNIWDRRSYN